MKTFYKYCFVILVISITILLAFRPKPPNKVNTNDSDEEFQRSVIKQLSIVEKDSSPGNDSTRREANNQTVDGNKTDIAHQSHNSRCNSSSRGRHCPETKLKPQVKPCTSTVFVLLTINSKANHFHRRLSIRQTWGNSSYFTLRTKNDHAWKTVFVVSQSSNATIRKLIQREAALYGDLVITNIVEHVKNLTRKTLFGMQWAAKHCKSVFVYKGDDDVFVNAPKLYHHLTGVRRSNAYKKFFLGRLAERTALKPCRLKTHKYYVSPEDYQADTFPPFASGFAYVLSYDVLKQMLTVVPKVKILQSIDDVYVGILASKINVRPRNHPGFHVYYPYLRPTHRFTRYEVNRRFAEHGIVKVSLMKQMYRMALQMAPRIF